MLEDILKTYKESAKVIDWKKYNINDLFFEYIKHENDDLGEHYYAGIICRVWGYSGRIYTQCNKHVPFEQCYDTVIDAVDYVLRKRVWENLDSSLYGDPTAPDKAFHIALKRQRSILLANLTAQKRQSNFNTLSMDEMYEEYNDAAEGLFDMTDDEPAEYDEDQVGLKELISNHEPLEVLLLDQVCYNNWESLKSIITNVKRITLTEFEYYHNNYDIDLDTFKRTLWLITKLSNKQIMSALKKVLYIIGKEQYD